MTKKLSFSSPEPVSNAASKDSLNRNRPDNQGHHFIATKPNQTKKKRRLVSFYPCAFRYCCSLQCINVFRSVPREEKEGVSSAHNSVRVNHSVFTSQKRVSLSSGSSPLASSSRKSRRINFLNPQSLPWTKR